MDSRLYAATGEPVSFQWIQAIFNQYERSKDFAPEQAVWREQETMRVPDEKLKRAVIELSLDQNFVMFVNWITASYADALIHTSVTNADSRDYSAGKAAAMGSLLEEIAAMTNNKAEHDRNMMAAIKQRQKAFV